MRKRNGKKLRRLEEGQQKRKSRKRIRKYLELLIDGKGGGGVIEGRGE